MGRAVFSWLQSATTLLDLLNLTYSTFECSMCTGRFLPVFSEVSLLNHRLISVRYIIFCSSFLSENIFDLTNIERESM